MEFASGVPTQFSQGVRREKRPHNPLNPLVPYEKNFLDVWHPSFLYMPGCRSYRYIRNRKCCRFLNVAIFWEWMGRLKLGFFITIVSFTTGASVLAPSNQTQPYGIRLQMFDPNRYEFNTKNHANLWSLCLPKFEVAIFHSHLQLIMKFPPVQWTCRFFHDESIRIPPQSQCQEHKGDQFTWNPCTSRNKFIIYVITKELCFKTIQTCFHLSKKSIYRFLLLSHTQSQRVTLRFSQMSKGSFPALREMSRFFLANQGYDTWKR